MNSSKKFIVAMLACFGMSGMASASIGCSAGVAQLQTVNEVSKIGSESGFRPTNWNISVYQRDALTEVVFSFNASFYDELGNHNDTPEKGYAVFDENCYRVLWNIELADAGTH